MLHNALPKSTSPSSPEPSEAELMTMPLEQLEQMVFDRAQSFTAASAAPAAPAPAPAIAPASPVPTSTATAEAAPVMADPILVHDATAALAAAGLLPAALDALTPESLAKLQAIADDLRPGLYQLSNEDSLNDFLSSVANGTLDIGGGGGAAPGGGPPVGIGGPPAVEPPPVGL